MKREKHISAFAYMGFMQILQKIEDRMEAKYRAKYRNVGLIWLNRGLVFVFLSNQASVHLMS